MTRTRSPGSRPAGEIAGREVLERDRRLAGCGTRHLSTSVDADARVTARHVLAAGSCRGGGSDRMGIRGGEDRHRPDRLELDPFERVFEHLAEPLLSVLEVVEGTTSVERCQYPPRQPGLRSGRPEDGRAEHAGRERTRATLATAKAFRARGPGGQWITRWSAAESNGPSTGSGLRTSAWTAVTRNRQGAGTHRPGRSGSGRRWSPSYRWVGRIAR